MHREWSVLGREVSMAVVQTLLLLQMTGQTDTLSPEAAHAQDLSRDKYT